MKKIIYSIVAIIALAINANAQTEKGKYQIGGTLDIEIEKTKGNDYANTEFEISPEVGYFIKDNLSIGLGVSYSKYKAATSYQNTYNSYYLFARKYVNLSEQFKFFGQFEAGTGFGVEKYLDSDNKPTYKNREDNNIYVGIKPGFAFFPTKKFAIELSIDGLSYSSTKYKGFDSNGDKVSSSTENRFYLYGSSFYPNLGIKFHL